jgi:two-component system OmpR family sensor kinase
MSVAAIVALSGTPFVRHALPADSVVIVLALAAMAVGVMSALLAALLGRLIDDERAVWIGVALGLYSLVGVTASAVGVTVGQSLTAIGDARLAANMFVVAMMFVAVLRPEFRQRCGGRRALSLGLLWTGLVVLFGTLFPAVIDPIINSFEVRIGIATGGVVAGFLFAVFGWFTRARAHSWIGLGCMVIALAHVDKLSPTVTLVSPGLAFGAVRLLGMTLVMVGLGDLAVRVLHGVAQTGLSQQEELRLARLRLRKVAEQGHEIRNGLAGLAGAAGLLVTRVDESEVLRAAVASELARLRALLGPTGVDAEPESERYEVSTVLTEQVELRRLAGMDVRLDAEPDLVALGPRSMLAQVLTNLLANCAAHAPGSPVRIQAGRQDDTVFVRVADFGPGVPEGAERTVFQPGARGARSSGQGLGLHICEQLLRAAGGRIEIRPHRGVARGCTVLLRIPAAEQAEDRPRPPSWPRPRSALNNSGVGVG